MEFECNTPVYWLRDARIRASHETVRVVLLAQAGTFPAGYVGMMDHAASDTHDSVTIIMYTFSLIDDYYHDKVEDYPDQCFPETSAMSTYMHALPSKVGVLASRDP